MEIRIKTAEEFHAGNVTVEINCDGQAETAEKLVVRKPLCESSGCPALMHAAYQASESARNTLARKVLRYDLDREIQKERADQNRAWAEAKVAGLQHKVSELSVQLGRVTTTVLSAEVKDALSYVAVTGGQAAVLQEAVREIRKIVAPDAER